MRNKKAEQKINNTPLYTITSVVIIGVIICSWIISYKNYNSLWSHLYYNTELQLSKQVGIINRELMAIDNAALTLAGSPWIKEVLEDQNQKSLHQANTVLDRYNQGHDTSVCYLMDRDGTTIASSNRNTSSSFVNKNYSFRPYFTQAKELKPGHYFALGVTSGLRGYYSSAPVTDEKGGFLGVAVIKKNIDFIEENLSIYPYLFLINKDGIIFLSSRKEFLFQNLWPLSKDDLNSISESLQFGELKGIPLLHRKVRDKENINIGRKKIFFLSERIIKEGWRLVSLNSFEEINLGMLLSYGITCTLIIISILSAVTINYYKTKQWISRELVAEKRFQKIFSNAPGILIITDREQGRIRAINDYALTLLGFRENELLNSPVNIILKNQINPDEISLEKYHNIKFLYNKEGEPQDVIISATEIHYQDEECRLLFATDISKLKRAEQALALNERFSKEMFNTLPQIIFEADITGKIIYTNQYGLNYFLYNQDIIHISNLKHNNTGDDFSIYHLVHQKLHKKLGDSLKRIQNVKTHITEEFLFIKSDGSEFTGLLHNIPIIKDEQVTGFRGFIIDISLQKQGEAEKQKANKLESIGILAGGLAHDFNNILASINNGINFVELKYKHDEELSHLLADIQNAINRGKDITQQLLTFSKGGAPIKQVASISELIRKTADFVLSGSSNKCSYEFSDNLLPVDIDKGQISQVIQNLVINANQAMKGGGLIRIQAVNVDVEANSHHQIPKGRYVRITIQDTGPGISPKIIDKIFDPFFTTKSEGNGLGLATVHSIVTKHNGFIFVDSIHGKSTTFTLFLPASTKEPEKKEVPLQSIKSGSGSILLMDDDPLVLKTCSRLISYLGYEVTGAVSGEEAIEKYLQALIEKKPFDVVIMDLTIRGGMGGKDALKELKKIDVGVKAIVSSGYSNDPVMANYADFGFSGVISKPYKIEEISLLLNNIIKK